MHPKPEILEIEFGEIFAVDREGVEIVILEVATVLASFLVFSPEKPAASRTSEAMIDAIALTVTSPLSPLIIYLQKVERAQAR